MSPDSVATVQIAKSGAFASPGPQMPLSFLKNTERGEIIRISGKEDVRKYLSELGFLPGTVRERDPGKPREDERKRGQVPDAGDGAVTENRI